jgi:hypothetical protein
MNEIFKILSFLLLLMVLSCSKPDTIIDNNDDIVTPDTIIDYGDDIVLEFLDGLNDNSLYTLPSDSNGFYYMVLNNSLQTIQRITVKLSRNGETVYSPYSGYSQKLEWSSNLYWWLLEGDTVANITELYFNPYTGEYEYINLPPLINWEDQLVPTINSVCYTDEETGIGNSVIGAIPEMRDDTMKIVVKYKHKITKKEEGSMFFEVIGERIIKDSVLIILR